MKKCFVKICCIFLFIFAVISNFIMGYALEYSWNNDYNNEKYKTTEIHFFGNEGMILVIADKILFNGENINISQEQKEKNNYTVTAFSTFLLIYWIILLLVFEKEKGCNFTYENIDDIETLNKYNPLIAGCIADNREPLPRDIIAVIMGLIKKKYINLEMIPNLKSRKENYIYMISENYKVSNSKLDNIEKYVLNWIFGFYEQNQIDFLKKIKEIYNRKDFSKKMKELENISNEELHKLGANIPRVPMIIKAFNVFLVFFTVVLAVCHITLNGLSIQICESTAWMALILIIVAIFLIPLVAFIVHLILILVVFVKKTVKDEVSQHNGKKSVETAVLIILFFSCIVILLYFIIPDKYVCLDLIMIGLSVLIVKTDNLMTKHKDEILNDYYALNDIKFRIEEYSLIKDEQINYMKLWDEYIVYAVAFGIPIQIVNKLKSTHDEKEDLEHLLKCENLYYICKAYLEVMWEMDFKDKRTIKNKIFKLF